MHLIEPTWAWQNLYNAAADERSPFYGMEYSECECRYSVYNYYIHPQWDEFGSATLYAKVLYVSYKHGYAFIELLGEWNDVLYNDIKFLWENLVSFLVDEGIKYFVLIGENVLNFHGDDDSYYQEWFDNIEDGWIMAINFRKHVTEEMLRVRLDNYLIFDSRFDLANWRTYSPSDLFMLLNTRINRRLGM